MTTITWVRGCKTLGKVMTRNDDKYFTRKLLLDTLANDWRGFGQNSDRIIITSDNERG